jgi:hypothetical protein
MSNSIPKPPFQRRLNDFWAFEGLVSKRRGRAIVTADHCIKMKNRNHPAMNRMMEFA